MPDCTRFEELIGAAVDGELTESEQGALTAHLEQCEECRAYYEALRSVSRTIAEDCPAPPPDLTDRIMGAVRATAAKPKKIIPFSRYVRPAALAAAAALVIWAGVRMQPARTGSAAPEAMARGEVKSVAAAMPAERQNARTTEAEEAAPEEAKAVSRSALSRNDAAEDAVEAPMLAAAVPKSAELVLSGDEDLSALAARTELRFIDATACRDYEGLLRLQEALPECRILWTVTLGDQTVSSLDESLTLTNAQGLREALPYLPRVRTVDLRGTEIPQADRAALAETFPDIEFLWE